MIKLTKTSVESRLGVKSFDETVLHKALQRVPEIGVKGPWIAGGAVRRTLAGEKLDTDFDFFFRNAKQYDLFDETIKHRGGEVLTTTETNTTYLLPRVKVVLPEEGNKDDKYEKWLPEMKVQAINFQYYKSIEEVLDSFDFTITQFGYDGTDLYVGEFSLWDVARKRLVPHKITYATASVRRMLKYADQGYTICAGCISEVLQQVADHPQVIEADIKYID